MLAKQKTKYRNPSMDTAGEDEVSQQEFERHVYEICGHDRLDPQEQWGEVAQYVRSVDATRFYSYAILVPYNLV